jgi:hypothetical protein
MGIIGNTHGVSSASAPAPAANASNAQRLLGCLSAAPSEPCTELSWAADCCTGARAPASPSCTAPDGASGELTLAAVSSEPVAEPEVCTTRTVKGSTNSSGGKHRVESHTW